MSRKSRSWESWRQTWAWLAFGWNERRLHVLIAILAMVVVSHVAFWLSEKPLFDEATRRESLWAFSDRVVTFGTLAVAIAVWCGEIKEEWERRLPRRLFAWFLFEEKPVAICLGANLPGEHDARQLGQQIGAQMLRSIENSDQAKDPPPNKQLLFDPARFIQQELPLVVTSTEAFKPIRVVFRLTNKKQIDDVISEANRMSRALLWTPQTTGVREELLLTDSRFEEYCNFRSSTLSPSMIATVTEPLKKQF